MKAKSKKAKSAAPAEPVLIGYKGFGPGMVANFDGRAKAEGGAS